ncbi:MAG: VanZ family protein [Burkholderiales bacterium]|nr:VanZ family protein [Burkholderiales bacterium]
MARAPGSPLARELCVVYLLLIVYATLHPFTGWRDRGLSPFAWAEVWPRVVLPFDLALNAAAYLPLGLFLFWAARARLGGAGALLAAPVVGALVSGALESLQTYLPSRIPSLADFATNALGALVGALAGAVLFALLGGGDRARVGAWFADTAEGARSLILAGLWLFALLYPQSILFGHGSLIAWLGPVSGYPFTPAEFSRVESAVTAASLFAAGSLALRGLAPAAPRLLVLALFVGLAVGARALSQAILFPPEHLWAWLTPGAQRGLAVGAVLLVLTIALPRPMRLVLVAIAATFATVTVNFAPPNPYYMATVQDLNPGRFLNFNGLTQLVAAAWPYLVALYLPFALAADTRAAQSAR